MAKAKKADRRPFHETIVDAICNAVFIEDVEVLAALIVATKIPKNHNAIIAALKKRCAGTDNKLLSDALLDIIDQRNKAEEEELAKQQPVS